ncbi:MULTISPECIES: flippase [unclassified Methanoregula]|uniref:flippase n=1 Tax=unclassified Methanoregula TaxID=2649730 RepID=UPI0009C7C0B9|nr:MULTISPECIES: flippase [unclassified Methanoregula]OPX63690.1 MAG: putative flippase AglR [Methanoregula sp. PtaB.Bin085]OPY36143.1 MAG: putative flippase AglR [Methanoregula sp. PtaU1.Bin006]
MNIGQVQRQSLIVFGSIIATTLIGFVSTIWFARVLGPAPLGIYSLFLAYYAVLNLLGDGGFGGAAVKRISEGKEQDEYFSAFVVIRIFLLTVSITVLLFLEPYLTEVTSSGVFLWLMVALVIAVFHNCTASGVYGQGKIGVHQASLIVEYIVRVLFQLAFVYIGYSAAGLAGGFVAGMIAGGIVQVWYLQLRLVRFGMSHIRNLSGFSFWIFLTSGGSLIFSYTDTILIGFFMTNADVGIYRTALQLATVGSFTTLAFQTVLFPRISSWAAQGKFPDIEKALARACTYSLFLAVPACIGGWVLGYYLLYYIYGASFTGGVTPLVFLLLVQVVNIFMFLGTMSLNALDHPKEAFQVTAISAVVNIILNIVFIPIMGITGAAVATLLAIAVNAAGAYILLSKLVSVKIEYGPVRNILCAAGIMGIFLLVFRFFLPSPDMAAVLISVATGAGIYVMVLLKLDRDIHNEIRDVCTNFGLSWPRWL